MIARIQQTIVFFMIAAFAGLIWIVFPDYSRIYLLFLAVAGAYIAYLAILFIAIHYLNRHDTQPRATLGALMQAWLSESLTAPRVFLWRQPFRTQAIPDFVPDFSPSSDSSASSTKDGVVFIHGFFCNRSFWTPWMQQLLNEKRAFAAITMEPAFGSIDDYAPLVEAAVEKVTLATGKPPTLICHSMGGLAARAWLRSNSENDDRIKRVITIGTPHFGTVLSLQKSLLPFINTRQMQRFGNWTQQLAKDEPASRYAKFTCWYSNCDNIVVPTSTAMLPGADDRFVTAQGHVSMAFNNTVMQESLRLL
jgi:pimeloyl-ACP methyl ester carboxylesterase